MDGLRSKNTEIDGKSLTAGGILRAWETASMRDLEL